MDQIGGRIKHITNELKEYVETRLELLTITVSDRIALLIGRSVQKLVGYSILSIGLVFALVALSIYIGELLGNQALGYLVVSLPMVLIGLFIVLAGPKSIATKVQMQIINEILDTFNEKEKSKQLPFPEEPIKELHHDG